MRIENSFITSCEPLLAFFFFLELQTHWKHNNKRLYIRTNTQAFKWVLNFYSNLALNSREKSY